MVNQKRVAIIYALIILCFSFLSVRLYSLSKGNLSQKVLSGQYSRRIAVAEKSGFIYDTNLKILSHKQDGFAIAIIPDRIDSDINNLSFTLSEICQNTDASKIKTLFISKSPFTLYAPAGADVSKIKNVNGIYIYPIYNERFDVAPHIIGYSFNGSGTGIRHSLNALLEKRLLSKVQITFEANALSGGIDNTNAVLHDTGYEAQNGVVLTLDEKIQKICTSLEGEYMDMGAVIVTEIDTGKIRGISSFPSFDANNMSHYLDSDRGEFINRTTSLFTPGSVFKLVVAAAALEKDINLFDYEYECTGTFETSDASFRCHNLSGHGTQKLDTAFANSCNTYFISLGNKIGGDAILQMARQMGVAGIVRADTLFAVPANMPNKDKITENVLANMSFGQGELLMSPLDFVNILSVCATGFKGELSIIEGVISDGKMLQKEKGQRFRVLNEEICEKLRLMMIKCVQEGTGQKAYISDDFSGGKTATAQTGQKNKNGKELHHFWFCGIYPAKMPKYSIIILCDGNGRNQYSPAEIFAKITKGLVNCGF